MSHPILFYDGDCGLCHRVVAWLVRRDRRGVLRFAPLGGTTAAVHNVTDRTTIVLWRDGTSLRRRSAAALGCLDLLGGGWRVLAQVLRWVPTRIADWGYDRIAAGRAGWFAAPTATCPLLPPALRARFLG